MLKYFYLFFSRFPPFPIIDLQENMNKCAALRVEEKSFASGNSNWIDEMEGRACRVKCNAGVDASCQV